METDPQIAQLYANDSCDPDRLESGCRPGC